MQGALVVPSEDYSHRPPCIGGLAGEGRPPGTDKKAKKNMKPNMRIESESELTGQPTSPAAQDLTAFRKLITAKAKGTLHPQEVLAAVYRHIQSGFPVSRATAAGGMSFMVVTDLNKFAVIVSLADEAESPDVDLLDSWVCNFGCRSCGG